MRKWRGRTIYGQTAQLGFKENEEAMGYQAAWCSAIHEAAIRQVVPQTEDNDAQREI